MRYRTNFWTLYERKSLMGTDPAFVPSFCVGSNSGMLSPSWDLIAAKRQCWASGKHPAHNFSRPSSASWIPFRMCAPTEEKRLAEESSDNRSTGVELPAYVNIEKYVAGSAFVGYLVFAIFFAPGSFTDLGEIQKILAGKIDEVNDLFFAIFNLVGAVSITFAAVLNAGAGRQRKLSTGSFSFLGAFIGYFALGPYLFGREYATDVKREEVEERGLISRILESRIFGAQVLLYTLWIYGFTFGLFTPGSEQLHDAMFYGASVDLGRLFVSDRGVFLTIVDAFLLSAMFWGPLTEDMRRRGWFANGQETESWFTALSILSAPGLGPALYLVLRPRLPSKTTGSAQVTGNE